MEFINIKLWESWQPFNSTIDVVGNFLRFLSNQNIGACYKPRWGWIRQWEQWPQGLNAVNPTANCKLKPGLLFSKRVVQTADHYPSYDPTNPNRKSLPAVQPQTSEPFTWRTVELNMEANSYYSNLSNQSCNFIRCRWLRFATHPLPPLVYSIYA